MKVKKIKSYRLSEETLNQIEKLSTLTLRNATNVIEVAIKEMFEKHIISNSKIKVRWTNGFGDDISQTEYKFWIEKGTERINVPNEIIKDFISENQTESIVGVNIFRNKLVSEKNSKKLYDLVTKNQD